MGDQNALAKVCDKYLPIITAYAASINGHADSSEDIAQEVFLRVMPEISDYRPTASVKRICSILPKISYKNIEENRGLSS